MKKAALYAPRIKRLFSKLKKEGGRIAPASVDDPMEQLLRGILSNYASEQRAAAALSKLRAAMIDLNELRVTPVADIVEIIGVDYPRPRAAAQEITQTLLAVFNRTHALDLDFLRTAARRTAESFLDSLDGLSAYARATVILRCHEGNAVPVDENTVAFLQKGRFVAPDATVDQVQRFLGKQVRQRDAETFFVLLKRYAATHSPRRAAKAALASAKPKRKTKQPVARKQKKAPAKKTAGKAPAQARKKVKSARADHKKAGGAGKARRGR